MNTDIHLQYLYKHFVRTSQRTQPCSINRSVYIMVSPQILLVQWNPYSGNVEGRRTRRRLTKIAWRFVEISNQPLSQFCSLKGSKGDRIKARLTLLSYRGWKFPWFSSAARRTPGYRNKTGHGPFSAPASNRDLVKLDSYLVAKKPSADAVVVLLTQSPASRRNKFLPIIPHIPAMCSWSINMTTWRLSAKRKIR